MKSTYQLFRLPLLAALVFGLLFTSCRDNRYDGLTVKDPVPDGSITFPDAVYPGTTLPYMDANAFVLPNTTNSVASGNINVRIRVPRGKAIQAVNVIGQRRNTTSVPVLTAAPVEGVSPLLSPVLGTLTAGVSNAAFTTRTTAPNFTTGTISGQGTNEATWTISVAALNAIPGTVGPVAVNQVLRCIFVVDFTDGTRAFSVELRAWFGA